MKCFVLACVIILTSLFANPASADTPMPDRGVDAVSLSSWGNDRLRIMVRVPDSMPTGAPVVIKGKLVSKGVDVRSVARRVKLRSGSQSPSLRVKRSGKFRFAMAPSAVAGTKTFQLTVFRRDGKPKRIAFSVQIVSADIAPKGDPNDWSPFEPAVAEGVRYDPCRPITYSIDPAGAYATATQDIAEAFRRIGVASGLTFQPGAAGTSDIAITFRTVAQYPQLEGYAGLGGPSAYEVTDDGRYWIGSSVVILRSDLAFVPGFDNPNEYSWGPLFTHEIGHAVGLGHAQGTEQNMYGGSGTSNGNFGAGDLTGYRYVGQERGCAPLDLYEVYLQPGWSIFY